MKAKSLFLTLVLGTLLYSVHSNAQNNKLDALEFSQKIADTTIQILDVRTQDEYNGGHIQNALLADWTDQPSFAERIKALDKTKPVYVYCLSGGRSSAAANSLSKQGFEQVYNLNGGIMAWKAKSLPVEAAKTEAQISLQTYLNSILIDQTTLVDIGASWCPPCRKMKPLIGNIVEQQGNKLALINIDAGTQELLLQELHVSTIPTFIIYKQGKEVWRGSGILSQQDIAKHF